MSGVILAEFRTAKAIVEAARSAFDKGLPALDLLSPIPLEDGVAYLRPRHRRYAIGWVMVVAAASGAFLTYAMQWYSAVFDYPITSGGRPLHSWPAFLPAAYEAAILSAGVVGLLGWLWFCGLPRLHHRLFDAVAVERAVQNRYFLVFQDVKREEVAVLHPLAIHELSP